MTSQKLGDGEGSPSDQMFMLTAVMLARKAQVGGDYPFGCLIYLPAAGIVGEGYGTHIARDPTRHCEMIAIREACRKVDGLLLGATLYVTHEPCAMCCGAIRHSKISRVVFGSWRKDLPHIFRQNDYTARHLLRDTTNPPELVPGVLRATCVEMWASEVRRATA